MPIFLGMILGILWLWNSVSAVDFARGADVSWISEMEASGKHFYDDHGQEKEMLEILQEHQLNSIRLRVWVDPDNGWNGKEDVVAKALRAHKLGFRIMIDFHYSDSWADPGQQTIPKAWSSLAITPLIGAIYHHTHEVLEALQVAGITPEWVQIGNETNNGMLWEVGKASTSMPTFARMIDTGYVAAKQVFPHTKVIVHLSNAYDNALFRWMFDGLQSHGAQWDVIGMSLYPEDLTRWRDTANLAFQNMNDMVNRYGKEVMLVEIGMTYSQPDTAKAFIMKMIELVQKVPNRKGLGVFWWEPQCYDWKGYQKGLWQLDGKPSSGLDGFFAQGHHPPPSSSSSEPASHAHHESSSAKPQSSSSSAPAASLHEASPQGEQQFSLPWFDLLGRFKH